MTQQIIEKKMQMLSLRRFEADRLLRIWRKKYSHLLRGLDAAKEIRKMREKVRS